jgi:hypothetical protein
MKRRTIWLIVIGVIVAVLPAAAGPATHFFIAIPCEGVCPGTTYFIVVQAGGAAPLWVLALDANGEIDTSYSGTVTFGSTDPQGTMPAAYTFTAADQGGHLFDNAAILRTLGSQTMSVADSSNSAISGTWLVTVLAAGANASVPGLGLAGQILLVVLLGAVGTWILHSWL